MSSKSVTILLAFKKIRAFLNLYFSNFYHCHNYILKSNLGPWLSIMLKMFPHTASVSTRTRTHCFFFHEKFKSLQFQENFALRNLVRLRQILSIFRVIKHSDINFCWLTVSHRAIILSFSNLANSRLSWILTIVFHASSRSRPPMTIAAITPRMIPRKNTGGTQVRCACARTLKQFASS